MDSNLAKDSKKELSFRVLNCENFAMRILFFNLVVASCFVSASAWAHNVGSAALNSNGKILTLSQREAERYCQNVGSRLPTIRELAVYAESLGAFGIDKEWPTSGYPWEWYSIIYKVDSSGNTVTDFWYLKEGYEWPHEDASNFWFWSSSIVPNQPGMAYGMIGGNGSLGYNNRGLKDHMTARCVLVP